MLAPMTNPSRRELDRWLARNPLPDPAWSRDERREYFASMPQCVKREWEIYNSSIQCEAPDYNSGMADRARKRMARIDAMPPDLREVVYEHGLEVVQEFLNCGLRTPSRIKHLIDTVLHADFPWGQRRFKINKGPNAKRNPVEVENDRDEYYVAR